MILLLAASFISVFISFLAKELKQANLITWYTKVTFSKHYEGKLIQSGFYLQTAGAIQSYEFKFSVVDKNVADSLMRCSGKESELHYKEYLSPLPWQRVQRICGGQNLVR